MNPLNLRDFAVLSVCFQKRKRNKFTGISFDKVCSKWKAQVTHKLKSYYCGYYSNELEAAQAVNAKCVELEIPLRFPEIGLPEIKQVIIILKTIGRSKGAKDLP